ncbi:MAG: hypothetical protein WAS51_11840 [Ilumatobacteraceae bacterium]|nr:MAG: hypothetical protein IPM43_10340 [Actinomycetota bacterium]
MLFETECSEKSNDEIRDEHDQLVDRVAAALVAGDPARAEIEASLALHMRMGELWMWLKEHGAEQSPRLHASLLGL